MCHSDSVKLTSPFSYLVAVLVVLVGWVGATAVAAGAWDPVREASLTPVTEKRADADDRSLAVFTDIVQPDRQVACRVRDTQDVATDVPAAAIDVVVDRDGTQWHLIGMLPRGRDGLKVRCVPKDRRVDNATYSYAVVDGFTSRGKQGQAVAAVGLLGGIGLAAATFVARRRARAPEVAA